MKHPFILFSWEQKAISSFVSYNTSTAEYNTYEYTSIIVPHIRIKEQLEEALSTQQISQKALFIPKIYTMQKYIHTLYMRFIAKNEKPRVRLKIYEEVELLHTILQTYAMEIPYLYTALSLVDTATQYQWLCDIVALFNKFMLNDIEPEGKYVSSEHELLDMLCILMPLLYKTYIDELEKKGYTTPAYTTYRIARYIRENRERVISTLHKERILFFGFSGMEKIEEAIVKTLWENVHCEICLYTNIKKIDSIYTVVTPTHMRWIEEWNASFVIYSPMNSNVVTEIKPSSNIYIHNTNTLHEQLEYIDESIKKYILEYTQKNEVQPTIAIVPLNASILEALLHYLPKNSNISIGFPFVHSALAQLLQYCISLQENKFNGLYSKYTLIELLQNPYSMEMKVNPDDNSVQLFITYLNSIVNDVYIDVETVYNNFLQSTTFSVGEGKILNIEHVLFLYITQWASIDSLDSVIRILYSIYNTYIQHKEEYTHLQKPYIFKNMNFTLEENALNFLVTEGVSYFSCSLRNSGTSFIKESIFTILKQYIRSPKIPFSKPLGEEHVIEVIGLSEIQMLEFDYVFFIEAIEGNLPHEEEDFSLLPLHTQEKAFGIFSHYYMEREEYNFFSVLHLCSTIHILYTEGEGQNIGGKAQRSRFIEQYIWEKEKEAGRILEDTKQEIQSIVFPIKKEKSIDAVLYRRYIHTMDSIREAIVRELERKEFSQSRLATFIQCPYKFMLQYIFAIKTEDMISPLQQRFYLGECIHSALHFFLKQYIHTTITREQLLQQKNDILHYILSTINKEGYILPATQKIALEYILPKQITVFLEQQPEVFYIESTEEEYSATLYISTEFLDKNNNISLKTIHCKGRIDRVDRIENIDMQERIYCIVDYKTGKENYTSTNGVEKLFTAVEEGCTYKEYLPLLQKSPIQVLFYTYLFYENKPDSLITGCYYFLSGSQKDMKKHIQPNKNTQFTTEHIHIIEKILVDSVVEMLTMDTVECIRGTHCIYCEYKTLCL